MTPVVVLVVRVEYEIGPETPMGLIFEAAQELADKAKEYGKADVKVTLPPGDFDL
jgi:hypothetical protein